MYCVIFDIFIHSFIYYLLFINLSTLTVALLAINCTEETLPRDGVFIKQVYIVEPYSVPWCQTVLYQYLCRSVVKISVLEPVPSPIHYLITQGVRQGAVHGLSGHEGGGKRRKYTKFVKIWITKSIFCVRSGLAGCANSSHLMTIIPVHRRNNGNNDNGNY